MNGEIAQMIALTCHANAFLRGQRIPIFFPGNSWIDQGFAGEDGRTHGRLSARLYRALEEAIPAEANTSFRSG
ncbi:MAG: hypothetical protein HYY23_16645 [Verrucomicrobia bacterium]|nr:hypothetical protein [Verrucomicrobiota bacterium]